VEADVQVTSVFSTLNVSIRPYKSSKWKG